MADRVGRERSEEWPVMTQPSPMDADQVVALTHRVERKLAQFRRFAAARPPEQLDVVARPLLELLRDARLDAATVRAARDALKAIELEANIRACDGALRQALGHAKADLTLERGTAIHAARGYLRRADVLGASDDFKRAAQMALDAARFTGGVKQHGPTRAKPLDLAPRPPNRAKAFDAATAA
jgi:hypothetical protein